MGLYDKFSRLTQDRKQFQADGLNPFGTCIDEVYSATEGRIGNQKIVLAGTNNYLGLTFDAQAIAEGQAALAAQGTGTTGSRMANGSYGSHLQLEQELMAFFDRPTAIVFSTGYTANLAVISTLATPGSVVLIDADSHASIYDACALGGAEIIRFRHNDAKDLERRMVRLGERARDAIIIVEGIYSMLGDVAPLVEIVDIKRRLGGYLLVDEAHSFGVMGAHGRGLAEELGVVGSLLTVALFVFVCVRGMYIGMWAERAKQYFSAYMAYGLSFLWIGQFLINIGVNVGLLPTKGLTLPFLSYGGSSLVICCVCMGLLLRIEWESRTHLGSEETDFKESDFAEEPNHGR